MPFTFTFTLQSVLQKSKFQIELSTPVKILYYHLWKIMYDPISNSKELET